jgi:hypothetical protein
MESRASAILPLTPAVDHSDYEGYFVKLSAGEAAVVTSATDLPFGVILDGEDTDGQDSIAVCGGNAGPCEVKLNGTVSKGAYLQLESAGTVITDAGSGARVLVGIALDSGVAEELIPAVLIPPIGFSA